MDLQDLHTDSSYDDFQTKRIMTITGKHCADSSGQPDRLFEVMKARLEFFRSCFCIFGAMSFYKVFSSIFDH